MEPIPGSPFSVFLLVVEQDNVIIDKDVCPGLELLI